MNIKEQQSNQNFEKANRLQSFFNSAMMYLIEHDALAFDNGKIVIVTENIPEERFNVRCAKTVMMERIKNACEKM